MKSFKALFAKDRWKITKIFQWGHDEASHAHHTDLYLVNKYNGKQRTVTIDGLWELDDFEGGCYRG